MDNIIFANGYVNKDGKMHLYGKEQFYEAIKDYFSASNVVLTITKKDKGFSDGLRSYWFAVVLKSVQKAYELSGLIKSLAEVDQELRSKFLYYEVIDEQTDQIERVNHTLRDNESKVTGKMLREAIDLIIIWCAQSLDYAIPYPNEQLDFKTNAQLRSEQAGSDDLTTL